MSLLKRYVLKKFISSLLLSAIGLIGIFLVVDFFERVDEFVRRDMPYSDLIYYYIYKIPTIAFYTAPQAVLLATVITLATLAQNNEIVAMKSCGIGVTGITTPIIGSAFVVALLILVSNEYVTPIATKKMNYIFEVKVQKNAVFRTGDLHIDIKRTKIWLVAKDGATWTIDRLDPESGRMDNVSIFYKFGGLSVKKRIDRLPKKMREAERRETEAINYARNVQSESQQIKSRLETVDQGYMTEYGNRLNMEQQQVESSLKNAMDKGDTDAAVAAQRKLTQLAVSADRYTNIQNNRNLQEQQEQAQVGQKPYWKK